MFQTEGINKPAKQYDPDLPTNILWEEEINDLTGQFIGWLGLFHVEGTTDFVVEYRGRAKRAALYAAAEATAQKAKDFASSEFALEPGNAAAYAPDSVTVTVGGESFEVDKPTFENDAIHVHPRYPEPQEWIYDVTELNVGKFMIAQWKALNPDKLAALPKTAEELDERNRKWTAEEAALIVERSIR